MRLPLSRCLLAVLLALVAAGCGGQPSSSPMDIAASKLALVGLIQSLDTALATRDVVAIDSLYAADAVVLPANSPRVEGREAIHRLWAGMLSTPGVRLTLTHGPITMARTGDMAAMVGSYLYEATGPGHAPVSEPGKFLTVFTMRNGRWKIVLDMWNSDAPPGAAK